MHAPCLGSRSRVCCAIDCQALVRLAEIPVLSVPLFDNVFKLVGLPVWPLLAQSMRRW